MEGIMEITNNNTKHSTFFHLGYITLTAFVLLIMVLGLPLSTNAKSSIDNSAIFHPDPIIFSGPTYTGIAFGDPFNRLVPNSRYDPRVIYDSYGYLIDNTSYGIKNPDLGATPTCFGSGTGNPVPWNNLYHSGEDLYNFTTVNSSTWNNIVYTVADGTVIFVSQYDDNFYPGQVVIIQHNPPEGIFYSVYAHLNGPSISVVQGNPYLRGAVIGTVRYHEYSGIDINLLYHSTDDSHLHFEIRNFADAANIYQYPDTQCNILNPRNNGGKGYTSPNHPPDTFPSSTVHYVDPSWFIFTHQNHMFIPTVSRSN
jgi:hypothetical protein